MRKQCNIPLPLQKKREFKFNFEKRQFPFSFKCLSSRIPISTNYHSGNYVAGLAAAVVDTEKFEVIEHKYKSGSGPYNHTDWGDSATLTLKEPGVFDLYVSHYTLNGDRMDFELWFYDNIDRYIGKLYYRKYADSWTTGNATTISFIDAGGQSIISLNASDFSGTTYGNGYFHQTIDLRSSSIIKTYPETYISNTHQTNIEHSYSVSHPFFQLSKVRPYILNTKATYFSGTNGSNINLYLASGFDYFGQLSDRPGYPT